MNIMTPSSRILTGVIALVGLASLAGGMVGYALGTQRQGNATGTEGTTTLAGAPREEIAHQPELQDAQPVTTQSTGVPPALRAADPSGPLTGLTVGQPASRNGVILTLQEVAENPWEQGFELRFTLANTSGKELRFLFSPERMLSVEDSRGAHFNLRWAEYAGEVAVPNDQQVQLVRALFEGQVRHPGVDRVTVAATDLPGLGDASWQVPLTPETPADAREDTGRP